MDATLNAFGRLLHPMLRVLAPVDALLLPGAALCWVMSWPGHGELVGAFFGALCLWRGCKSASIALFAFDEYRWTTLRLAKLAITIWISIALVKIVWFIQV